MPQPSLPASSLSLNNCFGLPCTIAKLYLSRFPAGPMASLFHALILIFSVLVIPSIFSWYIQIPLFFLVLNCSQLSQLLPIQGAFSASCFLTPIPIPVVMAFLFEICLLKVLQLLYGNCALCSIGFLFIYASLSLYRQHF